MREIEPGREFSLMKGLKMEVPKPIQNEQAVYANSLDGDTKSFMNSFAKIRKLFKLAFDEYRTRNHDGEATDFNPAPFVQAFEEVNFSKARWYAIYKSIKETIENKHLSLESNWVQYAHLLASKQGRNQGWISLEQTLDRAMAVEDNIDRWPEPVSSSILDHAVYRPEVREKVPALYIVNNRNLLEPYLNHQTDGFHGQSGKYESGSHQSEKSQPIFGIFHNRRPLQYENPDSDTRLEKKGLIIIQVEMETTTMFTNRHKSHFHNRLCNVSSDKVEKIKVQLKSIEAKVGIETQEKIVKLIKYKIN